MHKRYFTTGCSRAKEKDVNKQKIALELAPYNWQLFTEKVRIAREHTEITHINVPQIVRLPITSMATVKRISISHNPFPIIPHIRAMDHAPEASLMAYKDLADVLIVTGDVPSNPMYPMYATNAIDLIRRFTEELPDVRVYAIADQYKHPKEGELHSNLMQKMDAGAVGFFTQPFFSIDLIKAFYEIIEDIEMELFLGVSPVLSAQFQQYWLRKNKAIFSTTFDFSWAYNISLARDIIAFAKEKSNSVYLMPIKCDIERYVTHIFQKDW